MKKNKIRIEILDENNKVISSSTISENKTKYINQTKQWNDVLETILTNDGENVA